ncbi:MAG: hypothetical protein ACTSYB_18760 [Candidatus Helarchaeota archaeon]
MPHRESSTIVFNIFLHGPPGSGRRTFLHWLIEHSNILDANFLKSIEHEYKQLQNQITNYMKRLKDMPRILKQTLDSFLQDKNKFDEAKRYFEIASYQIRELCRSYDEEINRCIERAIRTLQTSQEKPPSLEAELFSSIDLVGSSANIIYRIHYISDITPNVLELTNFLSLMDGLIFIWDAERDRVEENLHVFEELIDSLPPNQQYPLIIALNKVDLPNTIRAEDLRRLITQIQFEEKLQTSLFSDTPYHGLTIFETIAPQGVNVRYVLKNCVRMIYSSKQTQIHKLIYQEVHV